MLEKMNTFTNLLTRRISGERRAINAENPTGEKGKGGISASELGPCRKGNPCILDITPGATVTLADFSGCGLIDHIWFTLLDPICFQPHTLSGTILRIYWDQECTPSVEAPIGDFFCCGFDQNCIVNSAPIAVNPNRSFNCYFPMPFRKHFRITIQNCTNETIPRLFYQIDFRLLSTLPEDTVYFHAKWNQRLKNTANLGEDYTILSLPKADGHYVGTYLAVTSYEPYCWCEGELKFYIDGDLEYPTICGTGTEDYFGGAWAFGIPHNGHAVETTFSSLYTGFPYFSHPNVNQTISNRGLYRFHLLDPIMFNHMIRVTIQQIGKHDGHLFERIDDITSVAYWYQTHE